MSGPIRAFVALEIPDDLRARLAGAREDVARELPAARWTRPASWHLTLKFLGESETEVLDRLAANLAPRLRGRGVVEVRIGGGGFFPRPERQRVAWVGGVAGGADRVVEAVEQESTRLGFSPEKRPWTLHLTMARFNKRWPATAVERYLAWAESLRLPEFQCSEAVLFSSRLEPDGAVYTALERISLE